MRILQITLNSKSDSNRAALKSTEKKFDDICFDELSAIFNENAKWKLIANILGYNDHEAKWRKHRDPTKILLKYTEVITIEIKIDAINLMFFFYIWKSQKKVVIVN